jgi:hypothetical protein
VRKVGTGYQLTASDVSTPGGVHPLTNDTSSSFNITPGALDHFGWDSVGDQTAGQQFSVNVTAYDAYGNVKTNYAGTGAVLSSNLHGSSSGCSGACIVSVAFHNITTRFTNGVAQVDATGYTAESGRHLIITDSPVTKTSGDFTINPATLNHFGIANIGTQTAGQSFSVTATAEDAYGNTKTNYTGGATLSGTLGNSTADCASDHSTLTSGSSYACYPHYGSFGTWTNGTASANVTGYKAEMGDTVTATAGAITGTSNSFSINPRPTKLVYSGDSSGHYSDTVTVSATLTDTTGTPVPMPNQSITFKIGSQTVSATTNSSGVATTTITLAQGAGTPGVTASFATDGTYAYSHDSEPFTITQKPATLGYTGGMFFSTGSSSATTATFTLQATVTPAAGGSPDLTKAAPPVFLLYKSTNLTMTTPDQTCAATSVSSGGIATCMLSSLAIDNWTVIVKEPTNDYFTAPDSDPAVVTVYQPSTSQFATGGGWIIDPGLNSLPVAVSSANQHGNFGFSVKYKSGTTPQGQAVYVFRGSDGYDYVVKSNSWSGGGLTFGTLSSGTFSGASVVSFSGKCNINVINPANGQVVSSSGNDTYRVDATDGSAIGEPDFYAITVYTGNGTIYHQAATAPTPPATWNTNTTLQTSQLQLGGGGNGGGNLTVHSK